MIVESLSWLKTFITQLRGEQIIFWSPNLFTLFHCGLVRACPERHAWPGPVWLGLGCYCLWMSKLNIGSNTLGHVEEVFCTNSYFYSITLSVSPVYTVYTSSKNWKAKDLNSNIFIHSIILLIAWIFNFYISFLSSILKTISSNQNSFYNMRTFKSVSFKFQALICF